MSDKPDRREFDRFQVVLELEVSTKDAGGKKINEKAVLENISGGGIKFATQKLDRYFLGQVLYLTIYLPGTEEIMAFMRGRAMVVRIDPLNDLKMDDKSRGAFIAAKLATPLSFERVEVGKRENIRKSTENH